MRLLLAQLAPERGRVGANLDRLGQVLAVHPSDLAVFPELYLSGYRIGDEVHRLALAPDDPVERRLAELARQHRTALLVGAPVRSTERPGETSNAAVLVGPDGAVAVQRKRYLPTYGPFEEGQLYTPADRSQALRLGTHRVGVAICYDTFFPEPFRELALDGAELLVVISASPVTSRKLFERLLPARAIENACPVVYVNRVGVEDGIVFGGGSGAWDVRGEPIELRTVAAPDGGPDEQLLAGEVDLGDAGRWRPFRPVLRDVASRPPAPRAGTVSAFDSNPSLKN